MKLVCLTVFEMICRLYAVDMLDSGIRQVYSHSRLLKVSYVDDESATKCYTAEWIKNHGTPEYHYVRNKRTVNVVKSIQCFCLRGYNESTAAILGGMVDVSGYRYMINNRCEMQEAPMRCEVPGGKKPV